MIAAIVVLLAAIVTERNDWNTIPPNYATFEGSASAPGIASQWIPYGTFTDGVGDTEYLRVTSNLTGVAASVLDGYLERCGAAGYSYTEWPARNTRVLMLPATNDTSGSTIDLNLLQANNTRRIIDIFNDFNRFYATNSYGITTAQVGWFSGMIENSFASPVTASDPIYDEYGYIIGERSYQYNDGAATYFGSRRLDDIVVADGADIDPPIGTAWTSGLPFLASASNEWATVWPIYSALTNDLHILRGMDETNQVYTHTYPRRALSSWMGGNEALYDPESMNPVWGMDVWDGDGCGADLYRALELIPIKHTIEDVLKVDPGWKYEVPPALTSDFWTVSGPAGNFRLSPYPGYDGYWEGSKTNDDEVLWAWIEISGRWFSLSIYREPDGTWLVDEYNVEIAPDADAVDVAGYECRWTRLYDSRDDFVHWRTGTRRLDWKRLGIICQFERHMEETYSPREDEDLLPYVHLTSESHEGWRGIVDAEFPPTNAATFTVDIDLEDVAWESATNYTEVVTNDTGWTFPLARANTPSVGGGVTGGGGGTTLSITDGMVAEAIQEALGQAGDGVHTNLVQITNVTLYATTTNYADVTVSAWLDPETNLVIEARTVDYVTETAFEDFWATTNFIASTDPMSTNVLTMTNIVECTIHESKTNEVMVTNLVSVIRTPLVSAVVAVTNVVTVLDHMDIVSNQYFVSDSVPTTNAASTTTSSRKYVSPVKTTYDIYDEFNHGSIYDPGPGTNVVVITNYADLAYITYGTNQVTITNFINYTFLEATTNLVAITNFIDNAAVTNFVDRTFSLFAEVDFSPSIAPPGISIHFSDVQLWDGPGEYATATLPDFDVFLGDASATSIVVNLSLGLSKSASGLWTYTSSGDDDDTNDEIIRRMTHYSPTTNMWNDGFVSRIEFPSLDVMLTTSGYVAERYMSDLGDVRAARRKMAWDYLATNAWLRSERLFRMNPQSAPENTLRASDLNRFAMLYDINLAVNNKFYSMAGTYASEVALRSRIDAQDEAWLMSAVASTNVTASLAVTSMKDWVSPAGITYRAYFTCDVHFGGGEGPWAEVQTLVIYGQGDRGYFQYGPDNELPVGEIHWEVDEVSVGMPANASTAVSVDGHQDQLIKTLWRFKNLRDAER